MLGGRTAKMAVFRLTKDKTMILDSFTQDFRVGLRVLLKDKVFLLLSILVLALGIVGVSPVLGRDFTAEDNKPGSPKTAILGDKIWRRDFNADPNIVGQGVTINGKAATIIGVMPPGFEFPISEELWTPLYNEWPPT